MDDMVDDQRQLVREVVDTIELLRLKRRDQWRDDGHPECKRFTQEELCDLAYGAYKNMALGRTLRIPSRTDLLRIADYLECTIHETNDLLLSAQYMPQQIELRDDQYQAALERGRLLVQTLPLPALLVTRGMVVEAVNAPILSTHGLASLAQIRPEQCDAIHWYLNPSSPTFPRYAFNEDMWQRTVSSMVGMFRLLHQPFQQESWYRGLLRQYRTLPHFDTFWHQMPSINEAARDDIGTNLMLTPLSPVPIREQTHVVALGPTTFPHVAMVVPRDAAAQSVYQEIGCHVSENRWEAALKLGGSHGT